MLFPIYGQIPTQKHYHSFPVANLPTPRIYKIFLSRKCPVLQYIKIDVACLFSSFTCTQYMGHPVKKHTPWGLFHFTKQDRNSDPISDNDQPCFCLIANNWFYHMQKINTLAHSRSQELILSKRSVQVRQKNQFLGPKNLLIRLLLL